MNSASIDIKEMCLVPIQFATYSDEIWRDVVTMDVCHHFGSTFAIWPGRYYLWRPNFYLFVHNKERVKLASLRPVPLPQTKQTDASSSKKASTLISSKVIDKKIAKRSTIIVLIAMEVTDDSQEQISPIAVLILKEFAFFS